MKQLTKIVQQIGNGAHIYLPKELAGQKVIVTLVEKTIEDIKTEILDLLKPNLKHIIGVYLYGSYARKEQEPDSDIDILVVSDGKISLPKKINEYEIVTASLKQIEKTLKNNAVLILPILKEAEAILNEQLLEKYKKSKLTKNNTRWYIETTESSLKLAHDWIKDKDKQSIPNIVYPLVMRLRGLYLIESIINNKDYSNKGIKKRLSKEIYKIYREHRDNKTISPHSIDYNDIENLYALVNEYFKKVKKQWEKLR